MSDPKVLAQMTEQLNELLEKRVTEFEQGMHKMDDEEINQSCDRIKTVIDKLAKADEWVIVHTAYAPMFVVEGYHTSWPFRRGDLTQEHMANHLDRCEEYKMPMH